MKDYVVLQNVMVGKKGSVIQLSDEQAAPYLKGNLIQVAEKSESVSVPGNAEPIQSPPEKITVQKTVQKAKDIVSKKGKK